MIRRHISNFHSSPKPSWTAVADLDRQVGQVRNPRRIREVLNRSEVVERGWLGDGVEVFVTVAEEVACALRVASRHDQGRFRISVRVLVEPIECVVYRHVRCHGVYHHATPHLAVFERVQVEPGDDAEVVSASSQSKVQVGVRGLVGVDDPSVSEDDLLLSPGS